MGAGAFLPVHSHLAHKYCLLSHAHVKSFCSFPKSGSQLYGFPVGAVRLGERSLKLLSPP